MAVRTRSDAGQGRRHVADGDCASSTPPRRILSERGYSKLTLQAIEEESGEYRALVAYYFGSKQGLVEAIIDSLMEAEDEALRERLEEIEEPDERVRALIDEQRQISADWRGFRAFYELLPNIMRDERLREDLAADYAKSQGARPADAGRPGQPPGHGDAAGPWPARRAQRRHRRGSGRAVRRRPGALRPRGHLPPLGGHGARLPRGEAQA